MTTKLYFLPILLLIITISCKDNNASQQEIDTLDEAKEIWVKNKSSNYSFTYNQICFCEYRGELKITIVADTVYSAQYLETGKDVTVIIEDVEVKLVDAYPESLHTIDSLFDILINAAQNAEEFEGTYDATIGYPKSVSIDYSFAMADDEITYVLSNYKPLTSKEIPR